MKQQWTGLGLAVALPLVSMTVVPAQSLVQQTAEDRTTLSSEAEELNHQLLDVPPLPNQQLPCRQALWLCGGKVMEAIPRAERALKIQQRLHEGQDHPDVAISLNSLAVLYKDQGRLREAEPLFQESLTMRQRLFPEDHPDVATSLNNLAVLYKDQGRLREAEPLFQESLAMYRRLFSKDHRDVAASLNNLASLYTLSKDQGGLREAELLFQEALAIRRRLFEGDHRDVATSLKNLAVLYRAQGRLGEAEPLFQESLAMTQRLFEKNYPHVATSLNSLVQSNQARGKLGEAEPLSQKSLAMRRHPFLGDHPDVAAGLKNLAVLYRAQGRLGEAEPLFQESLAMYRRLFPEDHPDVANGLMSLGIFYQARENYVPALNLFTQAADAEEAILAENLRIGSERQKQQFLDLFQGSTSAYISFHLRDLPDNPGASRLALTTILRRKGRVLDTMGQMLQTLRDNLDAEGQKLFVQLASTQAQRAALSFRPLPRDAALRKQTLADRARLDGEIHRLEGELSIRSTEFRQITEPVTIEAVWQAIPSNAALVEFIQYEPFNARATGGQHKYGTPRYAAYVLLPDGTIQWRDLGEAAPIDSQIQYFRTLLSQGGWSFDDPKAAARKLDQLLMAPVREMTGNATHLLLSPDSSLNLLPFAALVDESGQYLVQNYLITYLTSGRDLLRARYRKQAPQAPLALTNPSYDSPGTLSQSVVDGNRSDSSDNRRSVSLTALNFSPLPGTKVEGEALGQLILDLTLLTGTEASENSLKSWQRPEILHLATHGFFLQPEVNPNPDEPSIGRENPLLRSGLALAGFNLRQSEGEDGVLTALEVAGLNLRGTRLVVLSACATGLGELTAGEGVYGLRRAFTLAGAESQLMSLWNVSDKGTQELMVAYYRQLQSGEGRGEALRQVQLEMLQNPDRAHPFFWAVFIPTGDWSPLE